MHPGFWHQRVPALSGPQAPPACAPAEALPATWFDTVLVVNTATGCVFYESGPDAGRPIYSMTKFLVALVTVDNVADLDATVTVVADDLAVASVGGHGIAAGDVISYRSLLEVMLISERNSAVRCLARTVGDLIYAQAGSTGTSGMTRFMEAERVKAWSLGLSLLIDNPGGYVSSQNIGSARDVTRLMRAAYDVPVLAPMLAATSGSVTVSGPSARSISLADPAPYARPGVVAHMLSGWNAAPYEQGYAALWQAPNGDLIALAGLFSLVSEGLNRTSLDFWREALPQDFPALDPDNTLVPTDSDIASVRLLIGADAAIEDESPAAHALTTAGVTRATTPRLLGTHCLSFDGVDDYLELATSLDWQFGAGDFTVECFFRWPNDRATPTVSGALMGCWDATTGDLGWLLRYNGTTTLFEFLWSTTGSDTASVQLVPSGHVFHTGINHVAVSRNGGTVRLLLNGSVASAAIAGTFASTLPLRIGAYGSDAPLQPFPGQMDEVRITKGIGRYPAGWTIGTDAGPCRKFPRA